MEMKTSLMMLTGIYSRKHYNSSRKPVVWSKLSPNSATNLAATEHSFFARPVCFVYFLLLIVVPGFRLNVFLFNCASF